jgi:hypothetical protein
MGVLSLLLLLPGADADDSLAKKMLPIYVKEAEAYSIAVESAPGQPLEIKKEPVFEWLNPVRNGVQHGVLFLWLRDGRPAALGCVFSHPYEKLPGRKIMHELHALDPEKLLVKRDAYNKWEPQAGLARAELPGAAAPAAARGARLVQMRRLAQEFTGHEIDREGKQWDLRLLPTPLYRYPEARTGVVDGALFALMAGAGTDPEVLLLIEAREQGGKLRWEYACGRFSDLEVHVQRKDKEVWSSVPSETNPFSHDPLHLYRLYPEKIVTLEGQVLARIRQPPDRPYGEIIIIEDR